MGEIKINFNKITGKIKPMHAVNNGPAYPKGSKRGNFETFCELGIPYVRNHDASLSEAYGSQHLVDIHCIFPDFSRDVNDESAYDFTLTDAYTKNIVDTGSKVFYRLGSSIEHWAKKYGTVVPKNFQKWSEICEHIIRHYNEGWANGFHYNIEYWEIWNEPDLDPDDGDNKKCWSGTRAEFFDFFEVASKYLKKCFPNLKIGGPALAGWEEWTEDFLFEMKKRNVELDFFSWHIYCADPKRITEKAERIKNMLLKYDFSKTKSILNEWNYVRDWNDPLQYISVIKGIKGATFCGAVMCEAQKCDIIDMIMYYDARIEKVWNGMFSSDTLLPLKGYYPFKMFDVLYRYKNSCESVAENNDIYVSAAKSEDGKTAIMICRYADEEEYDEKNVKLNITGGAKEYEAYILDEEHSFEFTGKICENCEIKLKQNTVYLLKSI